MDIPFGGAEATRATCVSSRCNQLPTAAAAAGHEATRRSASTPVCRPPLLLLLLLLLPLPSRAGGKGGISVDPKALSQRELEVLTRKLVQVGEGPWGWLQQ